jgi:transcriptional regulator with XRE-family HTH domain
MSRAITHNRLIRDPAFAKRLTQIVDNSPVVPAYNFGRLSWICDQFKERFNVSVSNESVRKWFSGEARPRPDKMRQLAEILRCDEAYLSLGKNPEMDLAAKQKHTRAVDGAVHILAGLINLSGHGVAFSDEDDPRVHDIDLYSIIGGKKRSFKAMLARDMGDWKYKFTSSPNPAGVTNVVVVRTSPLRFDLLIVPPEVILSDGKAQGGYYDLEMTRDDEDYFIGDHKLARVRDPAKI